MFVYVASVVDRARCRSALRDRLEIKWGSDRLIRGWTGDSALHLTSPALG